MCKAFLINLLILSSLLLGKISPVLAEYQTSVSTGVDYSTGDYGDSSDTEIWYFPLSVKLDTLDFVYKVTVPHIQITGPGTVVGPNATPADGDNQTTTESGMGDVIAAISYALFPYQPDEVFIELTGKVKFPTADENKRLGTGEYDYSFQVDGFYSAGMFGIFTTLGYKIYGDPPGIDYKNGSYYSLGGSYSLTHRFSLGLAYDFKEAATQRSEDQKELTAFASKKLSNKFKILGYLVKGLSDGSPDWGLGFNISYIL
ncbi:MAG: transporter [Gammaproteobacteria bacterium]|nr:transporter [Gammaproteobacteria bacterium]